MNKPKQWSLKRFWHWRGRMWAELPDDWTGTAHDYIRASDVTELLDLVEKLQREYDAERRRAEKAEALAQHYAKEEDCWFCKECGHCFGANEGQDDCPLCAAVARVGALGWSNLWIAKVLLAVKDNGWLPTELDQCTIDDWLNGLTMEDQKDERQPINKNITTDGGKGSGDEPIYERLGKEDAYHQGYLIGAVEYLVDVAQHLKALGDDEGVEVALSKAKGLLDLMKHEFLHVHDCTCGKCPANLPPPQG